MSLGEKKIISTIIQIGVLIVITLWIFVPLTLYYFPGFGSKLIFFYMYKCPWYSNHTDFGLYGLPPKYSRNFYLPSMKDDVKLGFWHILPESKRHGSPSVHEMEMLLSKGDPIILYLHGNALTRGGRHIVDLYKSLSSLNFHIVSVDYRGYGDSQGIPWTEDDVVSDALTAWSYVKKVSKGRSPIYVWGHSLGTGISSAMLKQLFLIGDSPKALILESPFTSMREGIRHHPLCKIYRDMPYFNEVFVKNAERNGVYFNTKENLLYVDCPILLLHSKDDHIIPSHFSETLYKIMKEHNKDVSIKLFPPGHGYFHKDLWKDPSFKSVVLNFVTKTMKVSPAIRE